jgi:hypothetical protein
MDIAAIVKQVKRDMLKYGRHNPTLMIEDTKGTYLKRLDFLPGTTLEKGKLLFELGHDLAMEHDIEAKEVRQLVWICEAWFSTAGSVEEMNRAPSPSKDPNRQEGLIVLILTIAEKNVTQTLQMVEVLRHGGILDLLPYGEMEEVRSPLLTSCLAGIMAASLSESELSEIIKKATE